MANGNGYNIMMSLPGTSSTNFITFEIVSAFFHFKKYSVILLKSLVQSDLRMKLLVYYPIS